MKLKLSSMKKLTTILTLSVLMFGCSSLTIEDATSSKDETQRILAMGLSLEGSLAEAKKLDTPHMVSVVSLQIKNAISKNIQDDKDLQASKKFERMTTVSEDGSKFISSEISEIIKDGFLATDIDELNYFIEGTKNLNSGLVNHTLQVSLTYNSKNSRNYSSIDFCDRWNNCEIESQTIRTSSSGAFNCSSDICKFSEEMEIRLSDEFLKETLDIGFSMQLISEKKTTKVKINKPFLMGYLNLAK